MSENEILKNSEGPVRVLTVPRKTDLTSEKKRLGWKNLGITQDCEPGGTITWYTYGDAGLECEITLERAINAGGHHHPGGPTGTIDPATFTLTGWEIPVTSVFTASDAGGKINQLTSTSSYSVYNFNHVRIPNLLELFATTGINLIGDKPWHPKNHWGTSATLQDIRDMGRAYYLEYQENLDINDISLKDGGLFDINQNWQAPHNSHRKGTNVDIRSTNMDPDQMDYFELIADNAGFDVVHEDDPPHWHCTKR